jgi:hypothetical protein
MLIFSVFIKMKLILSFHNSYPVKIEAGAFKKGIGFQFS